MDAKIEVPKEGPLDDIASMKEYMKSIQPKIRDQVELVTSDMIGQNVLYHISKNPQRSLVPNISWRRGEREDNTVPRVHMAPSLVGCVYGYQAIPDDVWYRESPDGSYRGGYYIHTVPFTVGLKPKTSILPDAKLSDEIWLVPHDNNELRYKVETRSRMVVQSASASSTKNGLVKTITYIVEVLPDTTLHLSKDIILTEGYWAIVQPMLPYASLEKQPELTYVKVDKAAFDKALVDHVAMLGYQEKPAFTKW